MSESVVLLLQNCTIFGVSSLHNNSRFDKIRFRSTNAMDYGIFVYSLTKTPADFVLSFLFVCFLIFVFFWFKLKKKTTTTTTPLQADNFSHASGVSSHYIVLHPVSSRASLTSGILVQFSRHSCLIGYHNI